MATHDDNRILTLAEAARQLKISRTKLYDYLGRELPVIRLGPRCVRVMQSDLDEFIRRRRQAA